MKSLSLGKKSLGYEINKLYLPFRFEGVVGSWEKYPPTLAVVIIHTAKLSCAMGLTVYLHHTTLA